MIYKASEEVKKLTRHCHCNFACLEGVEICAVFSRLKDNLLLKERRKEAACNYLLKHGHKSFYCNCPMRYQLFIQYRI